jgi:hypothetical protein
MLACGNVERLHESGDAVSEFGLIIFFRLHPEYLVSNLGDELDEL